MSFPISINYVPKQFDINMPQTAKFAAMWPAASSGKCPAIMSTLFSTDGQLLMDYVLANKTAVAPDMMRLCFGCAKLLSSENPLDAATCVSYYKNNDVAFKNAYKQFCFERKNHQSPVCKYVAANNMTMATQVFTDVCVTNDGYGVNPACNAFMLRYPTQANTALTKVCTLDNDLATSLTHVACAEHIKNNPSAQFDAIMIKYCAAHPDEPLCACISSNVSSELNPLCTDSNCMLNGYILTTNSMKCPTVDCMKVRQITNEGGFTGDLMERQCGESSTTKSNQSVALMIFLVLIITIILWGIILAGVEAVPKFIKTNNINKQIT
jgi:hypothetical protein